MGKLTRQYGSQSPHELAVSDTVASDVSILTSQNPKRPLQVPQAIVRHLYLSFNTPHPLMKTPTNAAQDYQRWFVTNKQNCIESSRIGNPSPSAIGMYALCIIDPFRHNTHTQVRSTQYVAGTQIETNYGVPRTSLPDTVNMNPNSLESTPLKLCIRSTMDSK